MKKLAVILITIVLLVASGLRIYTVNSREKYPIILEYSLNEEVPFEKDYFDIPDNTRSNGYSIKALGTELYSTEEFTEKYKIPENANLFNANYIYLVKVNIRNISSQLEEKGGINVHDFILQNGSSICYCCLDAYPFVNEHPDTMFSLRTETDMDFVIPFPIHDSNLTIEKLNKTSPHLVISLYPNKKTIALT